MGLGQFCDKNTTSNQHFSLEKRLLVENFNFSTWKNKFSEGENVCMDSPP